MKSFNVATNFSLKAGTHDKISVGILMSSDLKLIFDSLTFLIFKECRQVTQEPIRNISSEI